MDGYPSSRRETGAPQANPISGAGALGPQQQGTLRTLVLEVLVGGAQAVQGVPGADEGAGFQGHGERHGDRREGSGGKARSSRYREAFSISR